MADWIDGDGPNRTRGTGGDCNDTSHIGSVVFDDCEFSWRAGERPSRTRSGGGDCSDPSEPSSSIGRAVSGNCENFWSADERPSRTRSGGGEESDSWVGGVDFFFRAGELEGEGIRCYSRGTLSDPLTASLRNEGIVGHSA